MFCCTSCLLKTWLLEYKCACVRARVCVCVFSPSIFINVAVTLDLWHCFRLQTGFGNRAGRLVLSFLWLNVIGYWRKLHKLYLPWDIVRIKEGRKFEWLVDVESVWYTKWFIRVLNNNEQSTQI